MKRREEEGAGAAWLEPEPPPPLTTRRGASTKVQQPLLPLIEQQRRCSPTTYLAFLLACRAVPRCASRGIGKPQDIGALPSPPGCEVELLCPRGESSTMSV
ncbi:unnamed protein product [Lampetra planeri]